jgi:hypothetical protein
MSGSELETLLEAGLVLRVEADAGAAARDLQAAVVHLESAALLAGSDPTAGFVIAYDATRKAVTAHMRANGFRVRKGPGEHERTAGYATAALDPAIRDHLDALDEMRRLRHQSEYGARIIYPHELETALMHARAIVEAVERDVA